MAKARPGNRQRTRQAFVDEHGIACFGPCRRSKAKWAKVGRSKRGPWAICADCCGKNITPTDATASPRDEWGGWQRQIRAAERALAANRRRIESARSAQGTPAGRRSRRP